MGKAISDGEKGFDTIVAVKHPYSDDEERAFKVVSPCGMCRELISDYAKECFVILNIKWGNGKDEDRCINTRGIHDKCNGKNTLRGIPKRVSVLFQTDGKYCSQMVISSSSRT
ncbi:hypothetical protein [Peribacillus frigoritolerans]|uniref:hypothetical protein n=1 Tax=Peribacillus frigoritolerans TaxID=450367 RepID=UPI00399C6745